LLIEATLTIQYNDATPIRNPLGSPWNRKKKAHQQLKLFRPITASIG